MALTGFQRDVCRVSAGRRRAGGESYVGGGTALNVALELFRGQDTDLDRSLSNGEVAFHPGRLGGALPRITG